MLVVSFYYAQSNCLLQERGREKSDRDRNYIEWILTLQFFVRLENIRKCFTQKGGMFILEEFSKLTCSKKKIPIICFFLLLSIKTPPGTYLLDPLSVFRFAAFHIHSSLGRWPCMFSCLLLSFFWIGMPASCVVMLYLKHISFLHYSTTVSTFIITLVYVKYLLYKFLLCAHFSSIFLFLFCGV